MHLTLLPDACTTQGLETLQLYSFATPSERKSDTAGVGLLCSRAAMSLVSATAASGARTKSSTASEVAAYTARLQLLQAALHQSARAVTSSSRNAAAKDDGQSDRGGKLCGPRPCLMLAVRVVCRLHALQETVLVIWHGSGEYGYGAALTSCTPA